MLLETGQPHEHIELGGKFGGLDDPEFRKINPFAKVPALVDGETCVWESSAIIRYLAAQYCSGSIWPEDPRERTEADKWMDWAQSKLYPESNRLFWRLIRTPEDKQNKEKIEAGNAMLNEHLSAVEEQLEGRDYLACGRLTIADIIAGAPLYRYYAMPITRPKLPNVGRWYHALSQRPAYKQAIMVPFDDLRGRLAY